MLTATVHAILVHTQNTHRGVVVEISVPHGEELAKKTLNPRLGILGGISILGTTGIVVPYSTAAWEASVVQNIDVATAQGCAQLVFVVGGRGERLAQRLFALPEMAFVQIGDFFGLSLRHAATAGARHVTLAAMIGKLAKFAAGNESVHSRDGSDFRFLPSWRQPVPQRLLERIVALAPGVSDLAPPANLVSFHTLLCQAAGGLPRRCSAPMPWTYSWWKGGEVLGQYPGGSTPLCHPSGNIQRRRPR
jgi:cobalt-precorrin-5B (C1)-methyltransferase